MLKLVTYNRPQYEAFASRLRSNGFELVSLLEFCRSDQIAALLPERKLAVDVSSFACLVSGEPLLAAKLELLLYQMPSTTVFISDEDVAGKEAYLLRTMFDDMSNCEIIVPENNPEAKGLKRTLTALDEHALGEVLRRLTYDLIGQTEFKRAFESQAHTFRLFNALGEQPILSLLLLGPSGVGKTETARILCEAIAPGQPLPRINLGNYSSKDSLNSLIGSPRGYMGSEEGELSRKIDSSDAGVLLVDEFEKAEPAVWNFFLDLLETGTFTDSQGAEHNLQGFTIVFTTNCPLENLSSTFPAELLSRFSLKVHFSQLSMDDKRLFIKRYVSKIYERYLGLPPEVVPKLPKDIVDRALTEIDIGAINNIRILKNVTRSWVSDLVEKTRESSE